MTGLRQRRGSVLLLETAIACIVIGFVAFGLAQSGSSLYITAAAANKVETARCIAEVRATMASCADYERLESLNGQNNIDQAFQCVTVVGKEKIKQEVRTRIITVTVNDRNRSTGKPVYQLTVTRSAKVLNVTP